MVCRRPSLPWSSSSGAPRHPSRSSSPGWFREPAAVPTRWSTSTSTSPPSAGSSAWIWDRASLLKRPPTPSCPTWTSSPSLWPETSARSHHPNQPTQVAVLRPKARRVTRDQERTAKEKMGGVATHIDAHGNRTHAKIHTVMTHGGTTTPVRSGSPPTDHPPNRDSTGPLRHRRYPTSAPLSAAPLQPHSAFPSWIAKGITSSCSVPLPELEQHLWP